MASSVPIMNEAFGRLLKDELEAQLGYVRVEGLSFKVWVPTMWNRQLFAGPSRVYDRPFTLKQYRADLWKRRRLRLKRFFMNPYREARRRLKNVWEALRGRDEQDGWY